MNNSVTEGDIANLVGSAPYRKSSHPEHARTHEIVRNWFANHYSNKSGPTDATGRLIVPHTIFRQPWTDLGNVLLVGEGNLSFAKSILNIPTLGISAMTATTYESNKSLSDEGKLNADYLRCGGVIVMHSIDAANLDEVLKTHQFDTIIFQFPNVGSREPKHGHNPNHILVRRFLKSAAQILKPAGTVLISTVDSPHYQGVFQFDEAAKFAGFQEPTTYSFAPEDFPGYSHINTNDDKSAIENHTKFSTFAFRLSQ